MSLNPSVERVWKTLRSMGLTAEVTEFSESTRTAAEVAAWPPNTVFAVSPMDLVRIT